MPYAGAVFQNRSLTAIQWCKGWFRHATKCGAEPMYWAYQNGDYLRTIKAHLQICDYCSVMVYG